MQVRRAETPFVYPSSMPGRLGCFCLSATVHDAECLSVRFVWTPAPVLLGTYILWVVLHVTLSLVHGSSPGLQQAGMVVLKHLSWTACLAPCLCGRQGSRGDGQRSLPERHPQAFTGSTQGFLRRQTPFFFFFFGQTERSLGLKRTRPSLEH